MSEQAKQRVPNAGSFKPGDSRINRNGRPRTGLACSEKVRELVDPAEWIEFELTIARDATQPMERRSAAWHALIDRGFVKPPVGLEATVSQANDDHAWIDRMPLDERRAELDRTRALRAKYDKPDEAA